eukprot:1216196-Pyramimonas_sp.AAC.1
MVGRLCGGVSGAPRPPSQGEPIRAQKWWPRANGRGSSPHSRTHEQIQIRTQGLKEWASP